LCPHNGKQHRGELAALFPEADSGAPTAGIDLKRDPFLMWGSGDNEKDSLLARFLSLASVGNLLGLSLRFDPAGWSLFKTTSFNCCN